MRAISFEHGHKITFTQKKTTGILTLKKSFDKVFVNDYSGKRREKAKTVSIKKWSKSVKT